METVSHSLFLSSSQLEEISQYISSGEVSLRTSAIVSTPPQTPTSAFSPPQPQTSLLSTSPPSSSTASSHHLSPSLSRKPLPAVPLAKIRPISNLLPPPSPVSSASSTPSVSLSVSPGTMVRDALRTSTSDARSHELVASILHEDEKRSEEDESKKKKHNPFEEDVPLVAIDRLSLGDEKKKEETQTTVSTSHPLV
jgi:hypothetical protein